VAKTEPRASRDFHWYRQEAARFRQKAATANDSPLLRNSYVGLALEYERLAAVLERRTPAAKPERFPKSRAD
jgi:DICT domain-containing protein